MWNVIIVLVGIWGTLSWDAWVLLPSLQWDQIRITSRFVSYKKQKVLETLIRSDIIFGKVRLWHYDVGRCRGGWSPEKKEVRTHQSVTWPVAPQYPSPHWSTCHHHSPLCWPDQLKTLSFPLTNLMILLLKSLQCQFVEASIQATTQRLFSTLMSSHVPITRRKKK